MAASGRQRLSVSRRLQGILNGLVLRVRDRPAAGGGDPECMCPALEAIGDLLDAFAGEFEHGLRRAFVTTERVVVNERWLLIHRDPGAARVKR